MKRQARGKTARRCFLTVVPVVRLVPAAFLAWAVVFPAAVFARPERARNSARAPEAERGTRANALIPAFSASERALLSGLHIRGLQATKASARALARGRSLFFSERMSRTGSLSCATCHLPERGFGGFRTEAGLDTPPLAGLAGRAWFGFGGSSDSLVARTLAAWLDASEHALDLATLEQRASEVLRTAPYRAVDAASDVASFVESLAPGRSRFDAFVEEMEAGSSPVSLRPGEILGARLFVGEAGCVRCHFGPTLSNGYFHNTGTNVRPGSDRAAGLALARGNPFNCLRLARTDCVELTRARDTWENQGAVRTPGLRGVSRTAPYFHDGSARTLEEVVAHYARAPRASVGASELVPLSLSALDQRHLVSFLESLDPLATADKQAPRDEAQAEAGRAVFLRNERKAH